MSVLISEFHYVMKAVSPRYSAGKYYAMNFTCAFSQIKVLSWRTDERRDFIS